MHNQLGYLRRTLPATLFWIASGCGEGAVLGGVSDSWQNHAPLQTSRQETGAARIGGTVYVVGGLRTGFVATNTVEAYDIAGDSWSFIPPMPAALDHMGAVALGGKLYVIGG